MSLFVLHLLLHRLFGHSPVAPPAAPVCWSLVGSLGQHSVALQWSSLDSSYSLVVQAPGVFLDSLLGFFPLASGVCR